MMMVPIRGQLLGRPSAELELYSASIVLLPMRDLVAHGTMPVTAERQESNKTLQVEGTEANRFSHQGTGMRNSMSGNRKGLQTVPVEQRARRAAPGGL